MVFECMKLDRLTGDRKGVSTLKHRSVPKDNVAERVQCHTHKNLQETTRANVVRPGTSLRLWQIIQGVVLIVVIFGVTGKFSDIVDNVILNWTENKTASEKADIVWDRIISNRESESYPGFLEFLIRGFYSQTDQTERLTERIMFRPFGNKKKLLHSQGTVARVKFRAFPNALGYTGLFAADEAEGLVTFSKGSRVISNTTASWGMGLKIFRDNAPPAAGVFCNTPTTPRQVAGVNWNIFDSALCGHLDLFLGVLLFPLARKRPQFGPVKFWTSFANGPGLSNFADINEDGTPVEEPRYPFTLCMRARSDLADRFRGHPPWYVAYELLQYVENGVHLYDVFAVDAPAQLPALARKQAQMVKIGELWTASKFTTSRWADNHNVHFHQKFEDDLAGRPDWQPQMTLKNLVYEGYAYEHLYSDRPFANYDLTSKIQQHMPAAIVFFQALVDPEARKVFLEDDLGIKHLQDVAKSILLGLSVAPNPNKNAKFSGNPGVFTLLKNSLRRKQKMDDVITDITYTLGSTFFPKIPLFAGRAVGSTLNTTILPTSYASLTGAVVSTDLFASPRQNVAGSVLDGAEAFARSMDITFDGHAITVGNFETLRKLLSDPVMREVVEGGLKQYHDRFGTDFLEDISAAIFDKETGFRDVNSFVRAILDTDSPTDSQPSPTASDILENRTTSIFSSDFRAFIERIEPAMDRAGELKWFWTQEKVKA